MDFLRFFAFFWGFLLKLLLLLLKGTKFTTGYQKFDKNGPKQHNKLSLLPKVKKKASVQGRSPPQELEVGRRSGLYLLVSIKMRTKKSPGGADSAKIKTHFFQTISYHISMAIPHRTWILCKSQHSTGLPNTSKCLFK